MNASEFRDRLHQIAYTAEVNQRYHQIKQSRTWWWDKGVKIGVAVLALLALLAVFLPHDYKWLEILIASLAATAAVALNVIPVGEWVTEYGEMFRSWSDLLLAAEQLELKTENLLADAPTPEHHLERLSELASQQCQLDAAEHAPNDKLLARCQGDINERMYGANVRSYADAIRAHQQAEETIANHA